MPAKRPIIESNAKGSPKANRSTSLVGQLIITNPKFDTKNPQKNIFIKFSVLINLYSLFNLDDKRDPKKIPIVVNNGNVIVAPAESSLYLNNNMLNQLSKSLAWHTIQMPYAWGGWILKTGWAKTDILPATKPKNIGEVKNNNLDFSFLDLSI